MVKKQFPGGISLIWIPRGDDGNDDAIDDAINDADDDEPYDLLDCSHIRCIVVCIMG